MSETISKSRFAKLPAIKKLSDQDKAVVSKLVKQNESGGISARRNRTLDIPDASVLGKIANHTAGNNNDAQNLFQVLPDMELARSILVSAILSPMDMVSVAINYGLESNELDDTLTGPMLRVVSEYFEKTYKIKKFLPDMLSDALFMKGSYPLLVLPETSIDQSINSSERLSLENFKGEISQEGWYTPYGILGRPDAKGDYTTSLENIWDYTGPSTENLARENYVAFKGFESGTGKVDLPGKVFVTDNPGVLSNPRLIEKMRKQRQGEIYGRRSKVFGKRPPGGTTVSTEAGVKVDTDLTLNKVEKMFYVNRSSATVPMQSILTTKQLKGSNKTNPLVMHLPSEAVIPVHVPGDVRHHIGYFVLLDVNGNPLAINYHEDFYSDIRASMNSDQAMSGQLLAAARRNTSGTSSWDNGSIDHMHRAYQQAVENDLLNRLRSGAVTGNYELANCQEVYRLMFARSLAKKNTMLLYVPAELMTYITFDYNQYGVGKSLLEDGKILGSLRAVMLFASTIAAVKNAADTRNINITLPEEDENPSETVAYMLGEYAKVNRNGFPIGETHPMELVTHLQNSGTVVTVQGNSAFPETRFDVESRDTGHKVVDREFDEELRRRHIQMFGLTPETMEASTGADFATTVVNQHMMLLKRVIQYQDEFEPFLSDFVRCYVSNSGQLISELLEVIEENKKDLPPEFKDKPEDFVFEFINLITLELPSPEMDHLENQMQGYDKYTEAVTKAIDAYVNAEALDPIASQGLEGHIDSIKVSLLTMFQRRYLREKNILPELDLFNTLSEEDGPGFNLLDETQDHLDGVLSSVESYLKRMTSVAKKRAKRVEKLNAEADAIANGAGDDLEGGETLPEGTDDFGLDEPEPEPETTDEPLDESLELDEEPLESEEEVEEIPEPDEPDEPEAEEEESIDLDIPEPPEPQA